MKKNNPTQKTTNLQIHPFPKGEIKGFSKIRTYNSYNIFWVHNTWTALGKSLHAIRLNA